MNSRMQRLALVVVCLLARSHRAAPPCPLVPVPKVYHDHGQTVPLLGPEATAIVLGTAATPAECYAAGQLQAHLTRRFRLTLPVCAEDSVPAAVRQLFLLGTRPTCARLDQLCRDRQFDLGPESPGPDGFVVEVTESAGVQTILVGGSNAPGVIYGQNAVFDLLQTADGQVVLPRVSLRDWPGIRWRGRPHWRPRLHLVPGVMDCYARCRLNFTDLRDGPGGIGMFGFPPGFAIDRDVTGEVLAQAHRRGMFVYGTVSCGVPPARFDAALAQFEALLGLGADGIWISFDDPGPGAEAPQLIGRALALADRHGLRGRQVANTQPVGSYNVIDTEFNRTTAAIPGYGDAKWFFTRVPCRQDLEQARTVGVRGLPAWWHNMVGGVPGGFLHNAAICVTMRQDGRPGYLEMQPLGHGWGQPTYEQLRDAARYTDTVMVWALWDGWPEEYVLGALGIWAWDPAGHDWERTRLAVYADVFGPSQATAARDFDDRLVALKSLFRLPERQYVPDRGWPCRLRTLADRPKALALIAELEALHAALCAAAPATSLLEPQRLQKVYLEPMGATLRYARAMTMLEYPEYSSDRVAEQLDALLETGRLEDRQTASRELAAARQQWTGELAAVTRELAGLKGIADYVAAWDERLQGFDSVEAYTARRIATANAAFRKVADARFAPVLVNQTLGPDESQVLFGPLSRPPAGGTVVAQIPPDDWLRLPPRWRGAWGIGPFRYDSQPLVGIAFARNTASEVGDYAEVRSRVAVPAFAGRLLLDAFINDTKYDTTYTRYRYLQLWANDQLIWEEDASAARSGQEWITVDITALAAPTATLALRFRLEDKRAVGCYGTAAFLGPVRLRAVARP